MNADSYEQIELSKDQLNDKELLLKPNQEVTLSMYMDKPIDMLSLIHISEPTRLR